MFLCRNCVDLGLWGCTLDYISHDSDFAIKVNISLANLTDHESTIIKDVEKKKKISKMKIKNFETFFWKKKNWARSKLHSWC